MVGLCAVTVPVRVGLPAPDVPQWLRDVQAGLAEVGRHEHVPLVELPRPATGFESVLLFQSYADDWPEVAATAGLEVDRVASTPRTTYGLTLFVTPGPEWELRLLSDRDRIDPATAAARLAALRRMLERLPARTDLVSGLAADVADLAVAGTFTTLDMGPPLAFWHRRLGMRARVWHAPYGQLFQQLLDPAGELARHRSAGTLLLVRPEDLGGPDGHSDAVIELAEAVRGFCATGGARVLLCRARAGGPGRAALPAPETARLYGVTDPLDEHADAAAHVPYTPEFFAALATAAVRRFAAAEPPALDALVLDTDDTLWRGSCAEEEVTVVPGSAADLLQRLAVEHARAGRRVALASRNSPVDVAAALGPTLRQEHLAAWAVGWDPPAEALLDVAGQLALPPERCLYVTGDPVAFAEGRAHLAEVPAVFVPPDEQQARRVVAHTWALDLPPAGWTGRRAG